MLSRYFDERINELVFQSSIPSVASQVGRRKVQGCSPGSNLKVDVFPGVLVSYFLVINFGGGSLPGEVTELILATFSGKDL